MKNKSFSFALGIFIIAILLLSFQSVEAISKNYCENRLPWQFKINDVGWVIPEPPIPTNVRRVPGGDVIFLLPPGAAFRVLDGPKCYAGYSWWKIGFITSDTKVEYVGWIMEGSNYYYIEPYPYISVQKVAPTQIPYSYSSRDPYDWDDMFDWRTLGPFDWSDIESFDWNDIDINDYDFSDIDSFDWTDIDINIFN